MGRGVTVKPATVEQVRSALRKRIRKYDDDRKKFPNRDGFAYRSASLVISELRKIDGDLFRIGVYLSERP